MQSFASFIINTDGRETGEASRKKETERKREREREREREKRGDREGQVAATRRAGNQTAPR
jgi:hypothetical protein